MRSKWNEQEASQYSDPLSLRAYSSRLIGGDEDLVLHGGGNTSVKLQTTDLFGDEHEVLYVKGSGWDLADIEPAGFAPVRLDVLKRMARLESLSDTDMVKQQRAAMLDPSAPNPSVEAILHAIIPYRFVDHTHADAVVTVTNAPSGEQMVKELYGDRVLLVPYVMPGFVLARKIAELTHDVDWSRLEGIVLMNHGVFSFADTAKESYERMIGLVSEAEELLRSRNALNVARTRPESIDCERLSRIRRAVSLAAGTPMLVRLDDSEEAAGFSTLTKLKDVCSQGPLTPDHVIRTKRLPLLIGDDVDASVARYIDDYKHYFLDNSDGTLTCLDPAPRWGVWPRHGLLSFGSTAKGARIVSDIVRHTSRSIQWAEAIGGWRALPEKDIFDVEYWELEQAKIRNQGKRPVLQGRVALVTGAGSGIGKACVAELLSRGAAVVALDIKGLATSEFERPDVKPIDCDVTDNRNLQAAVETAVREFGGIDIVVSNAGTFPDSRSIEDMDDEAWDRSLELNLTSHQCLIRFCVPYLRNGIQPAIVVVGSKNVPAPGRKASAYSVAKAGLAQLARVAALELGEYGIRINTVHPNAVFDTGMWSEQVLKTRAESYGLSIDEYKASNVLKTEVTAADVAMLVAEMAGPVFAKTTGAQIPVDGGNERVI